MATIVATAAEAIKRLNANPYSTTTCGRNSVVECQLPKLDVEGSNPFARSRLTSILAGNEAPGPGASQARGRSSRPCDPLVTASTDPPVVWIGGLFPCPVRASLVPPRSRLVRRVGRSTALPRQGSRRHWLGIVNGSGPAETEHDICVVDLARSAPAVASLNENVVPQLSNF